MLVKEVMIKSVRTVKKEDPIRTVAAIICTNKISGLPVVSESGKLAGMISEKDILNALLPSYSDFLMDPIAGRNFQSMEDSYREVLAKTVEELMTERVFSVFAEDPVMKAASQMALQRFRRLPVIDEEGQLVGIVSLGDIHKAIFKRELGLDG